MKKAERIHCPAPLPEDSTIPLFTRMLVPAPYQAPEKKAKKKGKEAKGGLRRKGTLDAVSGDTEAPSSHEGDEDEEEEECRCQNRRISDRGSRTVRLRPMVTGGRGHDVLPRFGPS